MAHAVSDPRRNLGAAILVVAGSFALVATLANAVSRAIPAFPTNLFGTLFALLLASFVLVPLAIVVAFTYFGVGGRGVYPLGGYSVRARMLFFLTGVVALAAQYSFLGLALVPVGPGSSLVPAETTIWVLDLIAVVAAATVSVVVIRVGVVQGLARGALPLAILLTAVSVVFPSVPGSPQSDWWDVPHGVGIVILGIAYWRAGVHTPPPVPEGTESLAE
ncbi:MAG TPA: hypothetical protein VIJ11_03200 [Galbitalea sp.]